ncbi:MAG: Gfo/Idh/MocA family oxidoreductase [Phycisphaerales bacterium]|nr:MAG: Gfo/Idh/MocA family oxidoreductase [Phycisphaerales bacterium]
MMQTGAGVAALTLMPEFATAAPQSEGSALPVAVIGVGRQGRAILGELQKMDAVQVAAICDIDERRRLSGQRRAGGAEVFPDHRAMLDKRKDIRTVFIATPTHLHRDVAVDAIQAGCNVYCEAPLASTIEDCRAIASAARSAVGIVQAGLQGRSNPIYKLARTFYRSDAVRHLVSLSAQYHKKQSWRTPSSDPAREKMLNWRLDPALSLGLAGEFGTHQFDVANWYLGQLPTTFRGSGSIRLFDDGREIADTVHCDIAYNDGVHFQYNATLGNSFEGRHEVFYGTNSAIKLAWTHGWMFKEADAPTQGWEVYANRQQFHNDEGITLIADATKLAAQGRLKEGVGLPNPPLYYSIADFLTSIIDQQPVVCSVEQGLRATVIGILANQAIVTGQTVTADEDMFKGT